MKKIKHSTVDNVHTTNNVCNKQYLIGELAHVHNVSQDLMHQLINTLIKEISTALVCGDRIELRGFGSFSVRKRDKKTIYDPKTKKISNVCQRGVLYFRASKILLKKLNNSV